MAGNGLFYPILGLACCLAFIYISFGDWKLGDTKAPKMGFVERNGTQFMVNGRAFYINGWNSYWFMDHAVEGYRKPRVRAMLRAARKMGLTVCRTWAFSDGGYNALQVFPGRFNEQVFKVSETFVAVMSYIFLRDSCCFCDWVLYLLNSCLIPTLMCLGSVFVIGFFL